MAVLTTHDLRSARMHADKALSLVEALTEDDLFARTHGRAAYVAFYEGRSEDCRHHALVCVREAERAGRPDIAGPAHSILYAEAFGISKDYASALWHAQQLTSTAIAAGDERQRLAGLRAQYQIETMRGRPERLESIERQLKSSAGGYRDALAYAEATAMRLGWNGDFAQAARLLEPLTVSLATLPERIEIMCILAFYLALDGRRDEAREWIQRAGPIAFEPGDVLARQYAADSTLYLSLAYSISGRYYLARRPLMARRELFAGEDAALFEAALALTQGTQTAEILHVCDRLRLANFGGLAKVLTAYVERLEEGTPTIPLTHAERDILIQLAMGFNQREIAERTHRSYATVRTHVRSALQKLSCSSPLAAVAKARTLDLIS
jgi:DNA-binding CsgD family transcriptional regulator